MEEGKILFYSFTRSVDFLLTVYLLLLYFLACSPYRKSTGS